MALETWVLGLEAPPVAAAARAGQFVNIGLPGGPLLRRPFSVYRAVEGVIEVLLRPVVVGTRMLAGMAPGARVRCLGPLGRGFRIDPRGGAVTLLSGGLGVAPMPLAAAEAAALGLEVTWVHGAASAAGLCREWWGDKVAWATLDGTQGALGSVLEAVPPVPRQLFACGPNGMLAAVAERWPWSQVAVETHMGCGTGVCLGCAVPRTVGGYDRACTEGPVYPAAEVDWARLPAPSRQEPAGLVL
ncbi:MAG: hypothetical protein ACREPI_00580 [Candidatus Dormibacterales bacterium]